MTGNSVFLRIPAFIFLLGSASCKKDGRAEEINPVLHAVKLEMPGNFPVADEISDNPLTLEGIELGRMLFYDVRLSGSNKISCASCHRQNLAFTDGTALSTAGVSGKQLQRNAPALFNLAWANSGLFWDGGAKNLESQAFGPLTNSDEMHQNLYELEAELNQIPDYVKRFRQVFGEGIKSANVVKALSQFQRTLISGNSRYDKYRRGEVDGVLSSIELQGLSLVNTKCRSCHSGELFTDNNFHNNGIDAVFRDDSDGIFKGRFRVSFDLNDIGKFKTPSLRNVMLTAPYMHDGRFKTVEEVLDHYNKGINVSATTDQLLFQRNETAGIPLTNLEKNTIIAFLNTLTDYQFIKNNKISDPNN